MTRMEQDEHDEKPLDPEVEKVRRKMVRLLAVSISIMFVGVMAVLAAIVYKVTSAEDEATVATVASGVPTDSPLADRIALPAGFEVISVSLSGNRLAVFGTGGDGRRTIVFDATTGERMGAIEFGTAR